MRLALALDRNYTHQRVRGICGQTKELDAELVLVELHRVTGLVAYEQLGRFNFVSQTTKRECFSRPGMNMYVERVSGPREVRELGARYLTELRRMDEIGVFIHPAANTS